MTVTQSAPQQRGSLAENAQDYEGGKPADRR